LGSAAYTIRLVAVYFGYQYQKQLKAVQLESLPIGRCRQGAAELKALRSQVNPHFLFNSLNTIRALIDESPPKAREGVTRLAELFRGGLRMSELNTISAPGRAADGRRIFGPRAAAFEIN